MKPRTTKAIVSGLFVALVGFWAIYSLVIPGVWTIYVAGRLGTSDSGARMQIERVVAWPSWHLFCYEGDIILSPSVHYVNQPDGSQLQLEFAPTRLPSHIFVDQMRKIE